MGIKSINKILKAIRHNATSLGDNPALPPEGDDKFLCTIVEKYCLENNVLDNLIDETSLGRAITRCMKEESTCYQMLERFATEGISQLFHINDVEGLTLTMNIVKKIETNDQPLFSSDGSDFTFEDIDDMNATTGEIYKRRFLNALVEGAALHYMHRCLEFMPDVDKVNSNLPELYDTIIKGNEALLFTQLAENNPDYTETATDGGNVDVTMSGGDENKVLIEAEGVILPILFAEGVKGILELAIAHGLPEDGEKAQFIISKSDFKFAEPWDQRLGLPMWKHLVAAVESLDFSIDEIGANFFLMELASLPVGDYKGLMKDVLARTKVGKRLLKDLCETIIENKERGDFEDVLDAHQSQLNTPDSNDESGMFYDETNADDLLLNDNVDY